MKSSVVVFVIEDHAPLVNHIQIIQQISLITEKLIFCRLVKSLHPTVLFWAVRIGKEVWDTPRGNLLVEMEEVFTPVVGVDGRYGKGKVFPYFSYKISSRCRGDGLVTP